MPNEIEIKFLIRDLEGLRGRLRQIGLHEKTPRTHEMNTLYDRNGQLRAGGEVLRIRKYGDSWKLTHKSRGENARHKTRKELETKVQDGETLHEVFEALGFRPSFRYEKYRSEWTDGTGDVVLDETPIGNIGEIEGPPEWIDGIAQKLDIRESDYINKSYAELFREWVATHNSTAQNMTFAEVKS